MAAAEMQGQCPQAVSGQVVEENGAPLPGASVSFSRNGPIIRGPHAIRTFETGLDGHFDATIDEAGTYTVLAKNESAGCPETHLAFYSTEPKVRITITCAGEVKNVLLRMGPKAGRIGQVVVRDAVSGRRVQTASITLRRVAAPELFMSTSTTYHDIAVPADTLVTYEVTAPLYIASPQVVTSVPSSGRVNLTVTLQPIP